MLNSSIGFGQSNSYAQPLHGRPAAHQPNTEGKGLDFSKSGSHAHPLTGKPAGKGLDFSESKVGQGMPVGEGQPVLQGKAAAGQGIVEPTDTFTPSSELSGSNPSYGSRSPMEME